MTSKSEIPVHPVQIRSPRTSRTYRSGQAPQVVTLRAYEVYSHIYGEQKALIEGGCRGGFSSGELIAFLYAHSFPKTEWRARVDEALRGLWV